MRAHEMRLAVDQRQIVDVIEPLAEMFARFLDHAILARLDLAHVDSDGAIDDHAEFSGAARQVGHARAGDHGLARHAAGIDAGAAQMTAFDDGGLASGLRQAHGQ